MGLWMMSTKRDIDARIANIGLHKTKCTIYGKPMDIQSVMFLE